MIRPPLFGKDSSPQYTAPRLAAMGTGAFSLIFLLLVIFVPAPKPKQKFETVRIVLDTTPVQDLFNKPGESSGEELEPQQEIQEITENFVPETTTESVTETPTETPVIQQSPAFEAIQPNKPEETPPVKTEPVVQEKTETTKPEPIKQEPQYTKRTFETKKSVEDLLAQQLESTESTSSQDFDWNFSENEGVSSTSQKVVQKKIDDKDSLSGSSATGSIKTTERQSTTESTKQEIQNDADQATTSSLKEIAKTEYKNKTYKNSNSSVNMKTAETSGGTSVSMDDGTSRTLEKPREPKINISSEMAQNISQTVTVKICFTVMPDGSVPENSVDFIPAGLLTEELKDDIRFQLSTWHFKNGTSKASASFDFTIQKK